MNIEKMLFDALRKEVTPQEVEPELPDGVFITDGTPHARCRVCEKSYELCYEPCDFSYDMSYCGGSPSCIP